MQRAMPSPKFSAWLPGPEGEGITRHERLKYSHSIPKGWNERLFFSWLYERRCSVWWLNFWYIQQRKYSQSRGLFWILSYLRSFSPSCWNTQLDLRMKESTSQRDLMVISSVMHARLKASTKIREKCFGRLSFADDAAVTTHSEDELQQLMNRGLSAWKKHQ